MTAAWLLATLALPVGLRFAAGLSSRAAEAAHPPIGRLLDLGDRTVHLVDLPGSEATALPLVFLHGASGNARDPLLAFGGSFRERRRIFLDRPGHGWSSRNGIGDAAPARQAEVVARTMERLGIRRAVVVGHSWGGAVVAAFAVHHPERAAGLVFLAPATHPWPGAAIDILYRLSAAPIAGALLDHLVVPTVGRLMIERSIAGVFAPDPAPADYRRAIGADLALRPAEWRANAEDVIGLHAHVDELSPRYREIGAPTLILSGTRDPIVRADIHAEGLARDIGGARLMWLDGIGHMPHHTARERVVAEIAGLIDTIEARRRGSDAEPGRTGPTGIS